MATRVDKTKGVASGPRAVILGVAMAAMAAASAGCPTYEDTNSGTYRERSPNPAASDRGQQSVEIDFFRYGDHAKAVLRYYRPGNVYGDPFGSETFCTWTRADADAFRGDSRRFQLPVRKSTEIPNGRLDGEIIGDGAMEATLYDTDSGDAIWETITLDRLEGTEPDPSCEGLEEFLVRPTFDLPNRQDNRLPDRADYTIANPVLTVQWVGFRRASGQGNNRTLVRVGDQAWSKRVPTTDEPIGGVAFDAENQEFHNSLSILLSAPPEDILTQTDSTAFTVGHVVVVDDSSGEGRFTWEDRREPIVASPLQSGVWPDGPKQQADASGKAILYVDGDIEDLADDLEHFEDEAGSARPRLTGLEELEESGVPDRSFFIADVAVNSREHLIVQMDVQPRVTQSSIPVQATDRYLKEGFAPLPRMLP